MRKSSTNPFLRSIFLPFIFTFPIFLVSVPYSLAQYDISATGNMGVTGNISISGSGNGIVFPDSSKQTTAGQKRYISTVIVSPAATETESGTALRNAIGAISDASETTPYLVKLEPGIYDIGSTALQMKPYVDLEGSGEIVTRITGLVIGSSTGVVVTADNMELRSITVENETSLYDTIAIYNPSGSPRLTHVTAIIRAPLTLTSDESITLKAGSFPLPPKTERCYGIYNYGASAILDGVTVNVAGTKNAYGIYNKNCDSHLHIRQANINVMFATSCYGLYNDNSSPRIAGVHSLAQQGESCYGIYNSNSSAPQLFNVIAEAGGDSTNAYGIYNFSSSPTLTNVIARASGGTAVNRGMTNNGSTSTVKADRCSFEGTHTAGTNHSIYNDPDFTLYLGASKLVGGANTAVGTWRCTNCYDGNYVGLATTCSSL